MKIPLPPNEEQRLTALRQYGVLDSPSEQAFDDLTLLAAQICQTPISLVSLVDEARQWFKAKLGFDQPETSRETSFCTYTILTGSAGLEVPDAREDPRFAANPLVTEGEQIQFYAGMPLINPEGHALGALCVMDRKPRVLSPDQWAAMAALGRQTMAQLEICKQALQLSKEVAKRELAEARLSEECRNLAQQQAEAQRLLVVAAKSRLALLSVLEDERRAGKHLRESEERFRQLAEHIDEVFWITDPTLQERIYVSPAYEKIWGRSCVDLVRTSQEWQEAIHPEDREQVEQAVASLKRSGAFDVCFRIRRTDGTERWIHDRGFAVRNNDGAVYRVAGLAEDTTDQRVLEEQIRSAQKMESLGQLAGGIAHDFNNILGGLTGFLYLAKLEAGEQPVLMDYLENIASCSQRAVDLVKQILAFSRQDKPEKEPVRLNLVLLEALKLLRASVPANIRIQTELTEVPMVQANATAVHQVIMNLGTNAWQAMADQNGLLKCELTAGKADAELLIRHPELRPGNYVRLSISDTGCGMDRATLERIFEPFFTTKEVGQGTGLGLAVVHGIMKTHEGAIAVESEPGVGTTFHLYFPELPSQPLPAPVQAAPIARGRGQHILLVDDEAAIACVGKLMLERLGYLVTSQTNPLEALATVQRDPTAFDLVITDLTMPGLNGEKLGRELLQLRPDLPILIATGFSVVMTPRRALEAGFRGLLAKPTSMQTLAETVRLALAPVGGE